MTRNLKVEIMQTTVLALVPGLLILLFFVLITPFAIRLGLPSILVVFVAIPLVLVPFELGYLLYQGRKLNGRFSLKSVVLYREKISFWQYFVFVPLLLLWAGICLGPIAAKVDLYFINKFFYWLPDWFFINGFIQNLGQYSKTVLIITWLFGLVFNGVIGPVVEELYFRGYLLPRLNQLKGWAPVINVILFSLYHFFTPWQNVARIIGLLPLVYTVWWKRNIYISIFTHCLANTIGMIGMLPMILKL